MRSSLTGIVVMLLASATALAGDTWPQWRGPNRDAKSDEKGLKLDWAEGEGPKLAWITEGFGGGVASVSIDRDRIYTVGNFPEGQSVVAADVKTGNVVWKHPITNGPPKHSHEGSRCTPTLDGEHLYVVSSNGSIACLKAADGEIVWQRDFKDFDGKMMSGWGYSESPLVDGDLVLCTPGADSAVVVALDKKTGKDVWKCAIEPFGNKGKEGAGYSSIVISHAGGVKHYVQLIGRGVLGISEQGKTLWNYGGVANGVANISTPVVDGDYVFASTAYGTGSALLHITKEGDGLKAEEKYFLDQKTMQNHHGGMVLLDGYVYCGHNQNAGIPVCVELKTGKMMWDANKRQAPGDGSAAAIYVDGHILMRYQNGIVATFAAKPDGMVVTGKFKPEYQERESWAHPVIVAGKLYLREQNKLMCYDLKN